MANYLKIKYKEKKGEAEKLLREYIPRPIASTNGIRLTIFNAVIKTFLDDEMQRNCEQILSCISKLKGNWEQRYNFNTPSIGLIQLVASAQKFKRQQQIEDSSNLQRVSQYKTDKFHAVKRMSEIAFKMYEIAELKEEDEEKKILDILELPSQGKILNKHFSNQENEYIPKFILFVDDENKSVILAIRGTASLKDIIVDLVCSEAEFLDGHAPQGMLLCAHRILDKCKNQIVNTLKENPGYKLTLTGHSLGGGVAILITMILLTDQFDEEIDMFNLRDDLKCYAYSPPPVYSDESLQRFKKNIVVVINGKDCVPRLCIASMDRLLLMMQAIDSEGMTFLQRTEVYLKSNRHDKVLEKLCSIIENVQTTYLKQLKHPGKILHINKISGQGNETNFKLCKSDSAIFENFVFYKHMIRDHESGYFRESLRKTKYIEK